MKQLLTLTAFTLLSLSLFAQATWSGNVAQLVYDNCAQCHNPSGIAPFSLLTYEEALDRADDIAGATAIGYMPPWHADLEYQSYSHERKLTPAEIATLAEWAGTGAPEGNPDDTPPPPVFSDDGFISAPPDLELQIPEYTSQATNFQDDYVCFSLPSGLTEDKKLRAYEVIPGNPQIVHHALVYVDTAGTYETDLSGYCGGPTEGLIGGYTPGAFPTVFPSDGEDFNLGYTIKAGSNIVLAMHFPEGSFGEVDDTKIRFYYYEDEVEIREIKTDPIISNWTFNIQANTIQEVQAQFGFLPIQYSILSVFPHMHLLGTYIESYAVTQAEDTINFARIPHWDFEWQQFYFFENIQVLPPWSTIYGKGIYDNTTGNPHNPNDPPQNVGAGLNTSDEMFLVYFHYLPYEEGDEFVNLEELTVLPTNLVEIPTAQRDFLTVYPNPFEERLNFNLQLDQASKVSLWIYDNEGRLVDRIMDQSQLSRGEHNVVWDVNGNLSSGIYHYSMNLNGALFNGKLIKQ